MIREGAEQAAFVAWFRLQFPRVLIHSIPNGAHLHGDAKQRARQMAKLKWEGLVPGMPDLGTPEWRYYVEMKRLKGGKLSDDQIRVQADLRAAGCTVINANGCDDAIRQIKALRAEAA